MGDDNKPFACNIDGCGMHFTNEDHLTVHKRRHQMRLNLNSSNIRNTVADQTPTPTRFIKIGEEYGLFQDLSNVNPFEEQFRKASQSVEKGQISINEASSILTSISEQDSLNTPIPVTAVENDLTVTTTTAEPSDLINSDDTSTVLPDDTPTDLGDTMPFPSNSLTSTTTLDSNDNEIEVIVPRSPEKTFLPSSLHVTNNTVTSTSACTVVQTPVITCVGLTTPSAPKTSTTGVPTAVVTRAVSSTDVTLSTQISQVSTVPVSINSGVTSNTTIQPVPAIAAPVFQLVFKLANGQTPAQFPLTFSTNPILATQPVPSPVVAVASKPATQQNQNNSLTKMKLIETIQNHRIVATGMSPPPSSSSSSSHSPTSNIQVATPVHAVSPPQINHSNSTVKSTTNGLNNIRNTGRRRKGHDDNPDEKRRKFLERNRAAANRCRQRRKQWIHNLESKAKELSDTNTQLQHEVTMLRSEVAHLKTMLLAHKDCPITLQQRAAQQPNMSSVTTVSLNTTNSVPVTSIIPDNNVVSTVISESENSLPLAVELVEIEVSSSQNSNIDSCRQSVL
ncbi:cyclic AMP-dependent transcription factor ATF-2-like [Centruroides vittatus]|uniref:cyclic AMP-dependent transcription factor ATF-2-like n=1 Tax=Centruroides vittatus TaxID=120091 RepID=UPI00351092E2